MDCSIKQKIDPQYFEALKKTLKNISNVKKGKRCEKGFHLDMPSLVGIKLTNRCNLRCKHCYEWSEHGYCQFMDEIKQNEELDIQVLRKILAETSDIKSGLYLWGGEPLCYSKFDELADLISGEDRICAICTNALLIENKLNSLIKIGKNLEVVIAMEGFEEDNDKIRGNGVFNKICAAIELLLKKRAEKEFLGKITIHTVINHTNYNRLFEYAQYVQSLSIDSLILCFPWYISEESSELMEEYINSKFLWLPALGNAKNRSWDSFKYGLPKEYATTIKNELKKIDNYNWKFNIRYFPKIKEDEIYPFLLGKNIYLQNRTSCNSISMRADIMPDASISVCKHFKEFNIGNLKEKSLKEIWNSEAFNKARCIIDEQLMPICAQCNNLYLHGET